MVLYCVDNPVFLGSVMLHRYGKSYTDVSLMIDYKLFSERNLIEVVEQLKKNNIFSEVFYAEMYFNLFQGKSKEEYENYCVSFFDEQFAKNQISCRDFEKIYTINDDWDGLINLYFNLKKQKYCWIAGGRDTENPLMENSVINGDFSLLELVEKYKYLSPLAEYAVPEMQVGTKQFFLDKLTNGYELWDKKQCIEQMESDIIEKIVQSYGICNVEDDKYLYVVNSYGAYFAMGEYLPNVKRRIGCSMYLYPEVFSVMNNTLLDYYFDEVDKIYYKAHPNDPIRDDKLFELHGNKMVNLTNAPFELVQQYLVNKNVKFKGIIGFESISLEMIDSRLFLENVIMGKEFVKTWYYYDSLFATLNMAKYLNRDIYVDDDVDYSQMVKLNKRKFDNMLNIYEEKYNNKTEKSIVVVNAIGAKKEEKNLDEYVCKYGDSNIIMFLNCELAEIFFENNDEIKDWLCPICIEKRGLDNNDEKLYRNEVIWIYTHGGMLHRKISDFSYEYVLHSQKIKVNVYQPKPNVAMDMCMNNMLMSKLR
jgi:hypothetical protein